MNAPAQDTLKQTILLIDDESGIHTSLRAVFKTPPPVTDLVVVGAMSFESGLDIARAQPPDIILLDLNFRGEGASGNMTAAQTLYLMQSTGLVDIAPTVIITGAVEWGDGWSYGKQWKEARYAGACGFLKKDFYLDPKNRPSLLHAFSEAMLEFQVRKSMGITFRERLNPLPA